MERLAKFMARCGVASRRKAEELINDEIVSVNGEVVTSCATIIDPEKDAVKVGNKRILPPPLKYFLLHKPLNTITTTTDTHGRKTVLDCLPAKHRDVYPVGRLDKNTTGLLLLTNDGEFTYALTHPSQEVEKTYHVVVKGRLDREHIEQLRQGISLDDGRVCSAEVSIKKKSKDETVLLMTIHEGRKRQIRRMIEALGHKVKKLQRIRIDFLTLGVLRPGESRHLSVQEVSRLKRKCMKE